MNHHPVLQEPLPCARIGCGRSARLSCAQADAVSWRDWSTEVEVSPRRRGLTAAPFKPTPQHGRDGNAPRTARTQARAAARRPPFDITWRYAKCGTCVPHLSHRCARRITHVMSSVGSASRSGTRSCVAGSCARACARTHPPARARAVHAPACAQPRCACAHVRLRVRSRLRVSRLSGLRHHHRHALGAWQLVRGLAVVVPVSRRARRVKVEASCCANLDAPARDAGLTRQQRPFRLPGSRRNLMQTLLLEVP